MQNDLIKIKICRHGNRYAGGTAFNWFNKTFAYKSVVYHQILYSIAMFQFILKADLQFMLVNKSIPKRFTFKKYMV